MNNRGDYWNKWSGNRQQNINDFQQNRGERWNQIENRTENRGDWFADRQDDRQDWRVDNREDWQDFRKDTWDYRWDRADELCDDIQDSRDDLFDDHWWAGCGWGGAYYPPSYQYPSNPWWWWVPVAWGSLSVAVSEPEPVYYDYGVTVIYEGDQVYQNGEPPVPAAEYAEQAMSFADVDQPPPPEPAEPAVAGAATPPVEEWMPLGVWALAQEEKGDAVMFFQISVNRDGLISGGYQNVMTGENKPIAGSVDKQSQRAAWHIGDNMNTVIETGLYNLTQDVTTVLMHFGKDQTQTWLMVRLPAPEMPGAPTKIDTTQNRQLPPVMGAKDKPAASGPSGVPAAK